jgi:acetylornithine deacetylase/succinyl-diaminopimelate desuccinylase-like protein
MESLSREQDSILELAIAIQQIPSPTNAELEVANFVEDQFHKIALVDVGQDSLHNAFARISGDGSKRPVIISAHTDTVFPAGTDLTIRFENKKQPGQGFIYGPGLADNALGVAGLIVLASTLKKYELKTRSDVWFVANVGEEGIGDLKGMRALVDRFCDQAIYIVVEGGSYGHIFHEAIGVKRYELSVETEGGHSWGDYGSANAIHLLSHLVSALDDIALPPEPKTTLNVGVIEGGTTVNTIAARASCQLDLRSTMPEVLAKLVNDVARLVINANNRGDVKVTMTQIGDRPAGKIPPETDLVKWATEALAQVGNNHVSYLAGSTDANIPISRGIPAVCIGLANSGNTHRTDEFLDPAHLAQGVGQLLLLTLAAAGFDD